MKKKIKKNFLECVYCLGCASKDGRRGEYRDTHKYRQ